MECRAVVSSLSDYLDDRNRQASDGEIERIEAHLAECPTCKNLELELSEIKHAARELPLHTPSHTLWARISKAIESEISTESGPVRETQVPLGWWGRLASRKFTFSLPQLAAAGAFAALLIVAGISGIFGGLNLRGAQSALLPEEGEIKADIERRLEAINARKAQWDSQRRAEFEQRLNKIDESLKQCRHILESNPGDADHQKMVRALYNEKRQLLEDVERLKW